MAQSRRWELNRPIACEMHRSSLETVSLVAALVLTGPFAAAQDETDDSQSESVSVPGLAIEEIVVYREQTLNTLRLEVYRVEEAFYDAFNAVNSNDEFDISCERRSPTGTHMSFRICEARFVKDLNEEFAESFLRGNPLPPINPVLMAKGRQLVDEMKNVAREDPAVMEAWLDLAEVTQRFEAERERRCAGRVMFCRR
jgi:hypothetical protein